MQLFDRLSTTTLCAVLSILILGPVVHADDTEIFFSHSSDAESANPNILLVLDTSGSMKRLDGGTTTRFDRMKVAMRTLLQGSSGVNVGLMGFSGANKGAGVRYPIVDLDEQSQTNCPNIDCPDEWSISRPANGKDDATEENLTGTFDWGNNNLKLGMVSADNEVLTVDETDDIVGSVYATSVAAETEVGATENSRIITSASQWFYNGTDKQNDDRYAYRFENVDIPNGAVVTSAYITFSQTSATAQTGNISALIKLESSANAAPLPDGLNGQESIAKRLISSTRGIQWNNIAPDNTGLSTPDPQADLKSVTPELKEIVNLVVTLPNWQVGNPLSFILDPVDEYIPGPDDIRKMHGVEAVDTLKPILHYTYNTASTIDIKTTSSTASVHLDEITEQNTQKVSRNVANPVSRLFFAAQSYEPRKLAFRFDDINIPKDAEIQTASLILNTSPAESEEQPIDEWELDSSSGFGTSQATPDTNGSGGSGQSASNESITININAEMTGTPMPYNNDILRNREISDTYKSWDDVPLTPDTELLSPNIANVVSEVVNSDTWVEGQSLSLVLSASKNYDNLLEKSVLVDTAKGDIPPLLRIVWKNATTVDSTGKNSLTTAIRFSEVNVPPQATITSARLVFTSASASIKPLKLQIFAENESASAPFENVPNNISSRQSTPKKASWTVEPWDTPNKVFYSEDFKEVVQSITDRDLWCRGYPLTIMLKKISGMATRQAISVDQSQIASPKLEITYDPNSVPAGAYCSTTTTVAELGTGANDATEDLGIDQVTVNATSLGGTNVNTSEKIIGLRFPSLAVPKGAVITNATLQLTQQNNAQHDQPFKIGGVAAMDSPDFDDDSNKITATHRTMLTSTVTNTIPENTQGDTRFITDVASLVQEKVQLADWSAGSPFIIVVEPTGQNSSGFTAFEGDEANAARLVVEYQSELVGTGTLMRDTLISVVDSMEPIAGTPIVGAYFEAAQYFGGSPIDYGLQRGNQAWRDITNRVSHPLSYVGGTVVRESGCTDSNLNANECISEKIISKNGATPTYISPIESECQQNHIVLLTDGSASSIPPREKVEAYTGEECSVPDKENEVCGIELAKWLNTNDIAPNINGDQNIQTHTIGFNLADPTFITNIANDGGGNFYEAESAAELLNAFKNIFVSVNSTDTSFVAPSATVSQANRLKNSDDIYFALFKPGSTARWSGNLKRYKLSAEKGEDADILDVNDKIAVDTETGRFYENAQSWWSKSADGDSVLLGGAAEQLESDGISHLARNVYTYTGVNKNLSNDTYNELLPTNEYLKKEKLLLPASLSSDEEYVSNLLNWAHGADVFDIDDDGNTDEPRAEMGDPLHSQPLLVNYANGRSVVHLATNEGFLHAIDHETGKENFAFIPETLLANLRKNYENNSTRNRPYGLDGGMTFWLDDANNNGLVDSDTDTAYLYIGMRRGGNQYYALDITDPDKPKYLWDITGGANSIDLIDTTADGDFSELGQTWSKPIKTKIFDGENKRDVLMFGAGYGSNQDPDDDIASSTTNAETEFEGTTTPPPPVDERQKREKDTVGRGFFIVDAITGEQLFHTDINIYSGLDYSVPGELRIIDINFDGLADQIYFGDMGGQVWRFDYNNDQTTTNDVDGRMNGGRIARFAGDTPESARRFYYPPDIALLSVSGEQQLSISIGSGWRAHPLDTVIQDRFYSFRMTQVYGAPTTEDGEIRYPEVTESSTGMIDLSTVDAVRTTNKHEKGWFLPLNPSEKILSSSVTIDNTIIFTSYIPSNADVQCGAGVIGNGFVYFVDQGTGNPVKNLDENDETSEDDNAANILTNNDRSRQLNASGIPPGVTVLFPEVGKATAFAGRDKLEEVDVINLKIRTFWQEHIDENL